MKKIILLLLTAYYLLLTTNSTAQNQHSIDSLNNLLNKTKQDSTKAYILYAISTEYWGNNYHKAEDYAQQCIKLSKQIDFKRGLGYAYYSLGINEAENGNYISALAYHKKALAFQIKINKESAIAATYNGIGNIYAEMGNSAEALKYYLKCLKIMDKTRNKDGIASSYNNIGIIYQDQGNYKEALKNYFDALKIRKQIDDKEGIADCYNNIGGILFIQQNFSEALNNFYASLKIRKTIGDKDGLGECYNNIGELNYFQENYTEALKNYSASLNIREDIGDKFGIATSYLNIGETYVKQKKYQDALRCFNYSFSISKEIGSLLRLLEIYKAYTDLDSVQGKFKEAFTHYKLSIAYRDSLINKENTKKIVQTQMQYDFDKKESFVKAEQEKKDAIAMKEVQRQKLVRNSFMGGFAVVLLFAGVFFTQRNKIEKGKKLSDELLLNILPEEVAEELKAKGSAEAKLMDEVTVLFTDFKGFTAMSEKLTPKELVRDIHECFSAFDHIIEKYGIEKIKTIGDAYMAAGGLPIPNKTHAVDVINAALEIAQFIEEGKARKMAMNEPYFEIRIGVHTGPVVAGIVGVKKFAYDIWGDTVNTASRMESSGEVGKVNISGTTYELVKDKFNCVHRGKVTAKGKGEIDMYFVEDRFL